LQGRHNGATALENCPCTERTHEHAGDLTNGSAIICRLVDLRTSDLVYTLGMSRTFLYIIGVTFVIVIVLKLLGLF